MNEITSEKRVPLWNEKIPFHMENDDFIPAIEAYNAGSCGAVLVFPGGGYVNKAPHEGPAIAKWLNSIGITAFVVDYRVAPYKNPAQLCDAMRAVKYVRYNAAKFGIDDNKIAVMGFSAGGHLAGSVSVHYDKAVYECTDGIDEVSARPDATILCYSVVDMYEYRHDGSRQNLLGQRALDCDKRLMSLQLNVTQNTPPAFLWHTAEDAAVPVQNTLLYAEALAKWAIPFEVHIYPFGHHGLGLAEEVPHTAAWTAALEKWLNLNEWK